MVGLLEEVVLHFCFHIVVEQVKLLKSATFLRRKVEIVVAVVLISAFSLFRQLAMAIFGSVPYHMLYVLFDARPSVKRDVHDV